MYKIYGVTRKNAEELQKKLIDSIVINWHHSLDTLHDESILDVMNKYHKDNQKFILGIDDDYGLSLEADDEIVSVEEFLKIDVYEELYGFDRETIPF